MIATWMMWAVMVAALLGVSALLAERALNERGWPTRGPWLVALAGSVAVPFLGLVRPSTSTGAGGAASMNQGWITVDPTWLTEMGAVAAATMPSLGARADTVLVASWIVLTIAAASALMGGLATLRARAARWHRARVQGEHVLLSRDFGPALVGVLSPEIVLPRWALRMSAEEQGLACRHEAEHRRAHDTWLLLAGAVSVTLMPWNVALWWQLRRLRAAVEVDCDTRVLKSGASKRAYGALLLELGSARGRSPLPVLALARSESLLERRLKMIVSNVRDRSPVRALGAACLSAALFVLACEAEAPTTVDGAEQGTFEAAEVSKQAAAGVISELRARGLGGEARFFLDGEELDALPDDVDPEDIDRVEVRKNDDGTASGVYVFTRPTPTVRESPEAEAAGSVRFRSSEGDDHRPLIYVDGVRIEGDLQSVVDAEDIERVEVIKGDAARQLYGPEAANGVVRITLKEAGEIVPR